MTTVKIVVLLMLNNDDSVRKIKEKSKLLS